MHTGPHTWSPGHQAEPRGTGVLAAAATLVKCLLLLLSALPLKQGTHRHRCQTLWQKTRVHQEARHAPKLRPPCPALETILLSHTPTPTSRQPPNPYHAHPNNKPQNNACPTTATDAHNPQAGPAGAPADPTPGCWCCWHGCWGHGRGCTAALLLPCSEQQPLAWCAVQQLQRCCLNTAASHHGILARPLARCVLVARPV